MVNIVDTQEQTLNELKEAQGFVRVNKVAHLLCEETSLGITMEVSVLYESLCLLQGFTKDAEKFCVKAKITQDTA